MSIDNRFKIELEYVGERPSDREDYDRPVSQADKLPPQPPGLDKAPPSMRPQDAGTPAH